MTEKSTKTGSPDRGRFPAKRKAEAVLRLLRGEDLDTLSRELGVTAATLSSWREGFLNGGTSSVTSGPQREYDQVPVQRASRPYTPLQHLHRRQNG